MATVDRHHRQRMVPGIGEEGQQRLAGNRVLVLGVGALGIMAADLLALRSRLELSYAFPA